MITSLSLLAAAVLVFAVTNIDDIFLLALFFADRSLRRRWVVLGQFVGIGALTLASALAAALALQVPDRWVALLGLLPLGLGVMRLPEAWRCLRGLEEEGDDAGAPAARAGVKFLSVAAVTVANGGDNLGVYIPLFARAPEHVVVYAAVFALMTAVWCALGLALAGNRFSGAALKRWGGVALPLVLVGLGMYVLSGWWQGAGG